MRRRTWVTLAAVGLVLCALGVALYLRGKAPPETARLLPEADAMVYVNVKPLRAATHFDASKITPSPSLQKFIDATGVVWERDIDSAAFALHRMADPTGPNGAVAFSEVVEGRFDSARMERYLAALAAFEPNGGQERYAGRTIYAIPSEGRVLRVAILGTDMIAGSNMPTTEQIHSILDRSRAAASPFAGSALLEARYRDVPAFSQAWGIGHIGLPFAQGNRLQVMGLELPLAPDSTFVASLRYTSGLHLRVEQITPSEAEAERSAKALNQLLNLFRGLQLAQQPTARTAEDVAMHQFTDSILIVQKKDRTELTATLPTDTLKRLGQ